MTWNQPSDEYPDGFDCPDERLVENYKLLIDLHKFYLDLLLKSVAAINVIIGGFTAFVLIKLEKVPSYAFLFPFLLSAGFAVTLFVTVPRCRELEIKMKQLVKRIGVGLGPHVSLTRLGSQVFMYLYALAAIGFLVLSFVPGAINERSEQISAGQPATAPEPKPENSNRIEVAPPVSGGRP